MLKNPFQNTLSPCAAQILPVRPSLLFIENFWPKSPVEFNNIRPSKAPSEESPTASRIQDVTGEIEALRERGSFPRKLDNWWSFDDAGVSSIVQGYRARSAPFMLGDARYDLDDQYLFTNEPDYASAIGDIAGRGGVYIGVGHTLSFVYPAWQGASHAFAMDVNARVPSVVVPAIGAMLAMSADRLDLLSLISGKPLPRNDEWRKLADAPPYVLTEFIRGLPRSYSFESIVETAFKMVMGEGRTAGEAIKYLSRVRAALFSDRPSAHSHFHPISALSARDERGRGGPLAGEESFRRARDIFIDGRITGVASPLQGSGLGAVAERMSAEGLLGSVLYISNAEDWLFEDLARARNGDPRTGVGDAEAALRSFFASIASAPMAADALAVFTHNCYPTVTKRLARYLQNAIPHAADAALAARSALELYPLRSEEGMVAREPIRGRPKLLEARLKADGAMKEIASALRKGWRGRPLDRAEAERTLSERSPYFGGRLTEWERGAVIGVFEDMGIIEGGGT